MNLAPSSYPTIDVIIQPTLPKLFLDGKNIEDSFVESTKAKEIFDKQTTRKNANQYCITLLGHHQVLEKNIKNLHEQIQLLPEKELSKKPTWLRIAELTSELSDVVKSIAEVVEEAYLKNDRLSKKSLDEILDETHLFLWCETTLKNLLDHIPKKKADFSGENSLQKRS